MTLDLSRREPDVADPAVTWFLSASPDLTPGVEHLPGLDGKPMLHNPGTGKYVSVTPTAAKLAVRFDGARTGAEILDSLALTPQDPTSLRIATMAQELRQLGFLCEPPTTEDVRIRLSRFALREHMPRLPLVTDISRLLEPLVAPARRVGARALITTWLLLAGVGATLGVYALTHVRVEAMPEHLWVLMPIIVIQIAVHELAHAVVCQYQRVPVRSAGIGLMLYVMPVGYVDRTDSHRVTSRAGRVMISVAGPLSDQVWFGVTGIVALTASSPVRELAVVLLVFQVFLTAMNLNPLTPSDGYHATTAALGIVNLRGKSLALVVHRLFRTPLPQHLERIGIRERRIMAGYGIACLAFALLLAAVAIRSLSHLIGAL